MYEDASYYSFIPSAQEEKISQSQPRRKQSIAEQPAEDDKADFRLLSSHTIALEPSKSCNPPKATLVRRCQSYSDFHYAVEIILGQEEKEVRRQSSQNWEVGKSDEIINELQYLDWHHKFENELWDASHEEYTSYQKQLELFQSHLDSLLLDTDSTLDLLGSLSTSFESVQGQTTNFQQQCEGILEEQSRIANLADDLDRNLRYYSYLGPITRRLNAPSAGHFVRSKDFSEMLLRLDECLQYMASHPSHRESSTFRSRYRLLMTRGLTLVRVYFVGELRGIASDVSQRIADRQLNDTTTSALLYAKFRVGASELKEVAQEIRKRSVVSAGAESGAEAEYQSLMNELYTSYSATRGRLVIPLSRKKIEAIAHDPSTSKDLVSFARSSIGYVRAVCSDEYELWREWFEGEEGLYDFLESVCEPLYDHLRPRIIHENRLLRLCELCTLIQTRYIHNPEDELDEFELTQLDFSVLIQPVLEDAQTRLVFLAQGIVRDGIERYKPKPNELDYPSRNRTVSLSGTKSQTPALSGRKASLRESMTPMPKDPQAVEGGDSPDGIWGFETEAAFQDWYPTLRKAIWLLSRIYKLVNSAVFDDLAHQIVHQTTLSLHHASALISSKATALDGQLFLIKHLLILKQQIVAFDIEYVTPDVFFDFSGVTNTFWELRERGGLFDPRNLWRVMGGDLLPKVVENMLDAKVELDGRLRTVINRFTNQSAAHITDPIGDATSTKAGNGGLQAVKRVQQLAEKEVPLLRSKLDAYLDDRRTRETLLASVQDQVVHNYEAWYDVFTAEKRSNGKQLSKKGKGREDEVWDPDMFSEWAGNLFNVGRLEVGDGESRSRSRSLSQAGSI